jgi:hypothetical protein
VKREKKSVEGDQEVIKLKEQMEKLDQLLLQKKITERAYERVRSELEKKIKETDKK